MPSSTDVTQLISDLDGGVLEEKLQHAIEEVAGAVHEYNRAGTVTLKFDIKALGSGNALQADHTISYSRPTLHGKSSEEDKTSSPIYVGPRGAVSAMPNDPAHDLFAQREKDTSNQEQE